MERVLVRAFLVTIVAVAISNVDPAYCQCPAGYGQYLGDWTGYAMGNRIGGGGVEVTLRHFANHHPDYCPDDPAAWWPYGTIIINRDYWILLQDCDGIVYYEDTFELEDVGDFKCNEFDYWVDVYWGRCKRPGEECCCPGVVCPGFYYDSQDVNSCTKARLFGRNLYWYCGP